MDLLVKSNAFRKKADEIVYTDIKEMDNEIEELESQNTSYF